MQNIVFDSVNAIVNIPNICKDLRSSQRDNMQDMVFDFVNDQTLKEVEEIMEFIKQSVISSFRIGRTITIGGETHTKKTDNDHAFMGYSYHVKIGDVLIT